MSEQIQCQWFRVPFGANEHWSAFFATMNDDFNGILARVQYGDALTPARRREVLDSLDIRNDFDAVLTASQMTANALEYPRGGHHALAQYMSYAAVIVAPLPNTLALASLFSLPHNMYWTCDMLAQRALAMSNVTGQAVVQTATRAKAQVNQRQKLEEQGNKAQIAYEKSVIRCLLTSAKGRRLSHKDPKYDWVQGDQARGKFSKI